jgi:glycine cleavage system H protein
MSRPEDLKYAATHEWVRVDGDIAEVGITDYATEQLSDLAFVDLPAKGTPASKNECFGEIESTKSVSDLLAPVSGEIIEVHTELADELEKISSSPYGEGWMIRVRMSDPSQLDSLLSAEEYAAQILTEEH